MSNNNNTQSKRFPRPYTNVTSFPTVCRCCGGTVHEGEITHKYIFGSAKPVYTHLPENCSNRNSKWIDRQDWWTRLKFALDCVKNGATFPIFKPIGRYPAPKQIQIFQPDVNIDNPLYDDSFKHHDTPEQEGELVEAVANPLDVEVEMDSEALDAVASQANAD